MIPGELRTRPRWVGWRTEWRESQSGLVKPTKVPVRAKSPKIHASSTNPKTWCSYEEAARAYRLHKDKTITQNGQKIKIMSGVGFALGDGILGIDFDHVPTSGAELDQLLDFIDGLKTYAEWSPGDNIHVLGFGSPNGIKNHSKTKFGAEIEVYGHGRYFTITGDQIEGTPSELSSVDSAVLKRIIKDEGITVKGDASDVSTDYEYKPGTRHNHLISFAARLMTQGVSRKDAEVMLRAEAEVIGLPKRGQDEVVKIVDWTYKTGGEGQLVAQQVRSLRIRSKANALYQQELMGEAAGYTSLTGSEIYAMPDEPTVYAIDELLPQGGNALLSAQHKAGKTSLALTLCKALCDEEHFLGEYQCSLAADSTVVFLNYELTEQQFARWVRKLGLTNRDRLIVKNLRGRNFPFWLPEYRKAIVEDLQDDKCSWLIIDPMIMAARGILQSENDSMQMAEFQSAVDQLKVMAGIENMVMTNHMGWESVNQDQGRSRGSSRQEDWGDSIWRLTTEGNGGHVPRSLSAFGRDVDLSPIELQFDRDTGTFRSLGMGRVEARNERVMREWCSKLRAWSRTHAGSWPNTRTARGEVGGKAGRREIVMAEAVQLGYVVVDHMGNSDIYRLTDSGARFVEGAQTDESS